jgi:hypothetical protein
LIDLFTFPSSALGISNSKLSTTKFVYLLSESDLLLFLFTGDYIFSASNGFGGDPEGFRTSNVN